MRFNEQILRDDNDSIIIKSFHSSVLPGKREYNAHHHTECELSLFITGSGVYSVGDREYSFGSGDMFLFGSNEAHCITEISGELNLLNIHFEPRILWETPENSELLKIFTARKKNFSNKFTHTDQELKGLILKAEKEMVKKEPGHRIQVKYALLAALIHIIRKYDYIKTDSRGPENFAVSERLKDAIIYINRNLEKNITLKDIADAACLTPTYFSAVFKKYNGISPWDYIKIKRVEKAIELLKTTNMTKLEIAEKCGFNSSSNFYKIFIEITGKKPGDYLPSLLLK